MAILVTGFGKYPSVRWVSNAMLVITAVSTLAVIVVLLPDPSQGKTTRWIGRIPYVGPFALRTVDATAYRGCLASRFRPISLLSILNRKI